MNKQADLDHYAEFLSKRSDESLDKLINSALLWLMKKLDELPAREREILLVQIRLTQMILEKIRRLEESTNTIYGYEGI